MIELRGDIFEGGGQILRTALAMSARTGQAFRLTRIRAGRPRPGLQRQHLAAVSLAQQLCGAEVGHAVRDSTTLEFFPGSLKAGEFAVDIGSAGSLTLLLQAVVWAAAAAPGECTFDLKGGSDVPWSPPLDYLHQVTLPFLSDLVDIQTVKIRRGFNPKAGGRWQFRLTPRNFPGRLELTVKPGAWKVAGKVVAGQGLAAARVAERVRDSLLVRWGEEVRVDVEYAPTVDNSISCCLWAEGHRFRCGATGLGESGKPAERIGREVAERLLNRLARPEPVDEHLADQLIPLLALQGGRMLCQEITPHCLANMAVVDSFLGPSFAYAGKLIQCESPH
jgi:RNA 3'-terminal phosphate cyclase (GTP)